MSLSRRALLAQTAALAACGGQRKIRKLEEAASVIDWRGPALDITQPVALAPAVCLADVAGVIERDAFHDNLILGNIWFSGGYEIMADEGNQARSVNYRVDEVEEYATLARTWADAVFGEALTSAGARWSRHATGIVPAPPRRTRSRGTGPLDGKDNQNLPRFTLEPTALPDGATAGISGTVLVPVVVYYYTHNGGWFVGQEQGSAAGARIRLLWSQHDGSTGSVVAFGEAGVRVIEPYVYSPNRARLEDYILEAETRTVALLTGQLAGT